MNSILLIAELHPYSFFKLRLDVHVHVYNRNLLSRINKLVHSSKATYSATKQESKTFLFQNLSLFWLIK